MKKIYMIGLALVLLIGPARAGVEVGLTRAAKKRVDKLAAKIAQLPQGQAPLTPLPAQPEIRPPDTPVTELYGGELLRVRGNPALGTVDFFVMKYEAKEVGGGAVSTAAGKPWTYITQQQAKAACLALGGGAHLLTLAEALTISREIEGIAWNWSGGLVGSGGMWRGFSSYAPSYYGDNGQAVQADVNGNPDDEPYVGIQAPPGGIEKRTHKLSSGAYIWDWAGNAFEWLDFNCATGSGYGLWDSTPYYQEWSAPGLQDYEKAEAGPAGNYVSLQNAGMYYGCTAAGNTALRGGSYVSGQYGGIYTFKAADTPVVSYPNVGFRCAR
jgi:hypothetical protein